MGNQEIAAGYLRINQLMSNMIDCVDEHNYAPLITKERLISLSEHLIEDIDDFIGLLHELAGVTDDDLKPHDDEELLKDASSADKN